MPRESELKRHHSRFDRESSPKRSRRDGKPTKERTPNRLSPEVRVKDDDRQNRRRPQDPLPLEKPHASNSKLTDRSNTGHSGTSTGRGGRSERGWWRDQEDGRRGRHRVSDAVGKNEKHEVGRGDDTRGQRGEGPSSQPTKKKFREEKLPLPHTEQVKKEDMAAERERGNRWHGYAGGRNRVQPHRARPERGAEGFVRRQGYGGGRVDKWKHDMFDEVNQSPTSKNEEDHVAKAEALLAL